MDDAKVLKILFVEDLPLDYELAEMELKKNGIQFLSKRVERRDDFIKSLQEFMPDVIISDFSLPEFNGMSALEILLDYDSSIPFIVLTGTLNEETAVDCMKAGATDYVIKEHMGRLPFAVKDAIHLRDVILEKNRTVEALFRSESRYRSMFENNHAVMLLINPEDGMIKDANPAAEAFYGFNRKELSSMNLSDISVKDESQISEKLKMAVSCNEKHFFSRHIQSGNSIRDVEIFMGPINYIDHILLYSIIHDITERKTAEAALQSSLKQKTELIREIYHRTKNSLQVILSMLALQTTHLDDEKTIKILQDMENRIMAMSLVHEKLYKTRSLSKIDLREYISDLVDLIKSGFASDSKRILLVERLEPAEVLIDTAVPCGLIINELITNAFKYAFPGDSKGEITIGISSSEERTIELVIRDNGCGFPDGFDINSEDTMGLQIVTNIVKYQLNGSVECINSPGVCWIIRFKDNIYGERI